MEGDEGEGLLSLADLRQRSRELAAQQRPQPSFNGKVREREGSAATPFSSALSASPLDVPPGGALTPPDAQHFAQLVSHFRQVMNAASERLRQYEGTLWQAETTANVDGSRYIADAPRPFSAGGGGSTLVGDGTTLRLRAPASSPTPAGAGYTAGNADVMASETAAHSQCQEVLDVLEGLTDIANRINSYLPQSLQSPNDGAAWRTDRLSPLGASQPQAAADSDPSNSGAVFTSAVLGPADALRTALLLHSRSLLLRDAYLLSSLLHAKSNQRVGETSHEAVTAHSNPHPHPHPHRRRLAQGLMLLKQSHQAVDAHYLSTSVLTLLLPYPAAGQAFAEPEEEEEAGAKASGAHEATATTGVELGDPAEQALYAKVVRHTKNAYKWESRLSLYAHQIRSAIHNAQTNGGMYADLLHLAQRICEEFNILRGAKNDVQLCVLQAHAGAYEASLKRGRKAVEVLSALCQQYRSSLQTVDAGGVLGAANQAEEVHSYVLLPVALYNLACTVDLLARRRAIREPSTRGNPERREARELFFQAYQLAEQFLGGSHEMVHELMRLFGVQRLERWKARTRAVEQPRHASSEMDPANGGGVSAAVAAVLLPEQPPPPAHEDHHHHHHQHRGVTPGRAGSVTLAGPFVPPQLQQRIVLSSSSTSASSFGRPAPPPFTFQPPSMVPPLPFGSNSREHSGVLPPPSDYASSIPQQQPRYPMPPARKPPHHLPVARATNSYGNEDLHQLTPAASDPALVALMLNPSMTSTNISESQNPSPTAPGHPPKPMPPCGQQQFAPPRPTPASLYHKNRAAAAAANNMNSNVNDSVMMNPNNNNNSSHYHTNSNMPPIVAKGGSFLLSSSNLSGSHMGGSVTGGAHHPRRDMFARPTGSVGSGTDGKASPLEIPAPPNALLGASSGIPESVFSGGGVMSESGMNESAGFNRSASSFQRSTYNGRRMSRSAISDLRSCHRLERPDDALSLSGPTPEFIPPNPTKEAEIAREKEEAQQKKRERRIRAFLPEDIERKKRKKEEKEERRRRRERHERKKEIFAKRERERAEEAEREAQRQAHAAYYAQLDGTNNTNDGVAGLASAGSGEEIAMSGVHDGSGGYGDGPSAQTMPPTARGEHDHGQGAGASGRSSPLHAEAAAGADIAAGPGAESGEEGVSGAAADGKAAYPDSGGPAAVLGDGKKPQSSVVEIAPSEGAASGSVSASGKKDRHSNSLSAHSPASSTKLLKKTKSKGGKRKGRGEANISIASTSQSQSIHAHERLDTARPGHHSGEEDELDDELSSLSDSTIPPSSEDDDGDDDEEEEEETVEERKDRYDVEMQIYFLCLHRKREKAACVIQRAWRCSVARLELYNRRQFFYHHLYIQQKAAALCIIGFMRATLTRKRLQDRIEHRAAEDLQRVQREREEIAAVHVLERAISRYLIRKRLRDRLRKELNLERDTRLSKYESAAIIVQRWWRIIPGVRAYWKQRAVEVAAEREARAWEERQYIAATRIQALVRGRQGRRQARRYKAQRQQEKEEKQRRLTWSTDLVKLALTEWCLRTRRMDHEARLEEQREYEAVQCITHGWQNALARRRFELALAKARQIRMAAEVIQRAYKRHYASRERRYLRELSRTVTTDRVNEEFRIFRATITLQCFARVVLAKAAYRRQKARYGRGVLYALTVLQSVGRGCLARRRFNMARVAEYERQRAEAETAAKMRQRNISVLQAFVLARNSAVLKEKKACQRLYDKIYIRRLVRQELKREKAAVAIQQAFRRYRKLKAAFIQDYQEQCAAAAAIMAVVKIQCAWRQWMARQAVRKQRWFARKAAEKRLIKEEVQAEQWVTDMHFFFREFEHDRRRITNLESDLRDTLAWVYKKETTEMLKTHLPGLLQDEILKDDDAQVPPMNVTAALEGYLNNEYVKKWCSLYDDDEEEDNAVIT